jgi:tRNA threonylcarbamoyl adenosine modification protein (Sua5/YciO/YrdC/YwlC family)
LARGYWYRFVACSCEKRNHRPEKGYWPALGPGDTGSCRNYWLLPDIPALLKAFWQYLCGQASGRCRTTMTDHSKDFSLFFLSMARIVEINPSNPQQRLIAQAVEMLQHGGVICYPTDTMYGIGCDIFNQKAVKRVYQIKRRPKDKPFSFMCASLTNISHYGHVGNNAYRLMRKNLPGPYTFVLSGTKVVPKIMLTKQKTVGIRVPDHPVCLAIIAALENPLLNTSAMLEDDEQPVCTCHDVDRLFGKQVDLIIDSGEIVPSPSTVISLLTEQPEILRVGKGDISSFL